jgi:hypothetical protein
MTAGPSSGLRPTDGYTRSNEAPRRATSGTVVAADPWPCNRSRAPPHAQDLEVRDSAHAASTR